MKVSYLLFFVPLLVGRVVSAPSDFAVDENVVRDLIAVENGPIERDILALNDARPVERDADAAKPFSVKVVSIAPDFGHGKIVFTGEVNTTHKKIDFTAPSHFVLKNVTTKLPKDFEPAVVIGPEYHVFSKRDEDTAPPTEPVVQDVLIKGSLIEYYVQLADKSLARHFSSTNIAFLEQSDLVHPRQLNLFMLLFTNGTSHA
ncbi:MAG: hypothetical protein Q9160_003846 [Pyrenula sp. 1 TL-2023]